MTQLSHRAHDDPNPLARQHEERQRQLEFLNAVQSKIAAIPAAQQEKKRSILTLQALQRGQYPNTDDAYAITDAASANAANNNNDDDDDDDDNSQPPSKRRATVPTDQAVATTSTSVASTSSSNAWQSMTPEQQQQAWAAYYASQGGSGRVDKRAVNAAAQHNATVAGDDADDTRPVHLTEAYYNPQSDGFYRPNPVTNEVHPYAFGRYRKSEAQQAEFDARRLEREAERVAKQKLEGGQ